jgi:hypothetical protein
MKARFGVRNLGHQRCIFSEIEKARIPQNPPTCGFKNPTFSCRPKVSVYKLCVTDNQHLVFLIPDSIIAE